MLEINSSIKCNVSECKHYDKSNHCKLTKIQVGGGCDCTDCKETECRSFEIK